jgi:hypothetical protein
MGMGVKLKEPRLVQHIERLAAEQRQPVEKVLETAVRAYLDELEKEAIHAETQAFWAMHEQLLSRYEGQHVAMYQGEVVDHDRDASRLEKRIRERFGWLPVLIAPVKPGPRRDVRWIGGRVEAIK